MKEYRQSIPKHLFHYKGNKKNNKLLKESKD